MDLLAQAIISGEYEFHEKYWDEISTDAKDMISNLLQVDPEIRLTADDALQCPYMILEDEALNAKDLSGAQKALKSKAEQPEGAAVCLFFYAGLTAIHFVWRFTDIALLNL